jgi:hypothetical protein
MTRLTLAGKPYFFHTRWMPAAGADRHYVCEVRHLGRLIITRRGRSRAGAATAARAQLRHLIANAPE